MSHLVGGTLAGLHLPKETVPDMGLQIAMQRVHKVSCVIFLGRNEAVGTSEEVIWDVGGNPVLPTAAGIVTVVCSSADDDIAGTGALVLHLQGLDNTYSVIEEEIDLDGLSNVTSTKEYLRINHAQVHSAGTALSIQGTITGNVGGNPQFRIEANKGSAHNGYYTIASGTTGYLNTVSYSSGKNATLLGCLYKKEDGESWVLVDETEIYRSNVTNDYKHCVVLPALTEIKLTAMSDAGTNSISGRAIITVVQDSELYPQEGIYELM